MIHFEETPLIQLKEHATRIYPEECCGFLYGTESEAGLRTVQEVRAVSNSREGDKRRRFEISPSDYLKAGEACLENKQPAAWNLSFAS